MTSYLLLVLVVFPILIGIINYFIGKKINGAREIIAILASIIELALMAYVAINYPISLNIIGLEFKVDGFRAIYGLVACFMWMCTLIFSKDYMLHHGNKDRYYLFYLLTLGATIGVFISNTLWTTFMFFEMMSLTSFVWVIHEQTKEAIDAALTYLAIAIISGMILLMGIFLLNSSIQTLRFDDIYIACKDGNISTKTFIAGICLLLGFGAKAGMFPLHIWLPKAHPVAPAPASALLSGILTKTGVYGIIVCVAYIFPAYKYFAIVLLIAAVITMVLGAILAVFSINFKRTLACSSMSQIGFILTGLSMMIFLGNENALAFEGSFLHMLNHSLIKLSLFMIAGVIFKNLHDLNLNKLQGYGRKKYFLMICFILGMLGIMGIPLFNGYISKTLIHESIVEFANELSGSNYILIKICEYLFLFSGGLTIAYMLKIFICVFIKKNNDASLQEKYDSKDSYMKWYSYLVIGLSSFILPFLGFIPNLTSNKLLPIANEFFNVNKESLHYVKYFSLENLKGAGISLAVGLIVYFAFIRLVLIKTNENKQKEYVNIWPNFLEIEKLIYRPLLFGWEKPLYNAITFLYGKFKIVCKAIYFAFLVIIRVLSESVDMLIYLCRKHVFRQYKYKFNPSPFSYKVGSRIDKLTRNTHGYYANVFKEGHEIAKEIRDTFYSTFAFDLMMACIGIVCVLSLMIIVNVI